MKHSVVIQLLSCARLFATLWTVACQAPLSMGFSRQEYWSELPFPFPGDPPHPGFEPMSPAGQADSLLLSHLGGPGHSVGQLTFFLQNVSGKKSKSRAVLY